MRYMAQSAEAGFAVERAIRLEQLAGQTLRATPGLVERIHLGGFSDARNLPSVVLVGPSYDAIRPSECAASQLSDNHEPCVFWVPLGGWCDDCTPPVVRGSPLLDAISNDSEMDGE
jgi:hypothetical protein